MKKGELSVHRISKIQMFRLKKKIKEGKKIVLKKKTVKKLMKV